MYFNLEVVGKFPKAVHFVFLVCFSNDVITEVHCNDLTHWGSRDHVKILIKDIKHWIEYEHNTVSELLSDLENSCELEDYFGDKKYPMNNEAWILLSNLEFNHNYSRVNCKNQENFLEGELYE